VPRNVEVKARIAHPGQIEEKLRKRAGEAKLLQQRDVFFRVPHGRLKLRILGEKEHAHLIYYERPDRPEPRASCYSILPVLDPEKTLAFLRQFLDVLGEVRKKRLLFLHGQTRIHLDDVEGLGHFLEIEVVLGPDQTEEEGKAILKDWANWLGVREEDIVPGAYIDLLQHQARKKSFL